jgi:hypothetical protein
VKKDFKSMAAKLVENIRNNNGKPFIFQHFTESFASGSTAPENQPAGNPGILSNRIKTFEQGFVK